MYVNILPPADPKFVLKRPTGQPTQWHGGLATRFGRDALSLGIRVLDLRRGGVVLMPASLCDTAIVPFVRAGLIVRLYRLDEQLRIDFSDLERKIDRSVVAIYVNHYLGRPAEID